MLIVEGTDCVGKTTLCKKLVVELEKCGCGMTLQHFGYLPNSWDFYNDYLKYINKTTVMDRFIMSEVAYGNTLREKSRINPETYRLLDGHLQRNASVTVVITATLDWLKIWLNTHYDSKRETFNLQQILDVNDAFIKLVNGDKFEFNKHYVNYDFHYHISPDVPMPSDNDIFIRNIVDLYIKRLNNLNHEEL